MCLLSRLRIVGAHLGASRPERLHERPTRGLAHGVGVRLERQSPQRDGPAGERLAVMRADLVEQDVLLARIHRLDRLQQEGWMTGMACGMRQRRDVLGETRTAITRTRVDEVIADAWVGA